MSSTDIEDIVPNHNKNYFRTVNHDVDKQLMNFMIELCNSQYDSNTQYGEKFTELRKKYHISPSKPDLTIMYQSLLNKHQIGENKSLQKYIRGKEMRSLSGVIVISILTSPYPEYTDKNGKTKTQKFSCKHDCFYCPREVDDAGREVNPRSYLSDEPAVARALQNGYDAARQFNDRAYQYVINNHTVDKIELIILGGTWTEYPHEYQEKYIRDCFWAANTFYDIEKRVKLSLLEEQKINESSKLCRIIGVTLEMRPDSINVQEIKRLRYLGCTRVQLGVQHTNNDILRKINRGCTIEDAKFALMLLKNNGYKVDAHWMPDLPGASPSEDKKMFDSILNNDDLHFDQWKIYPTATVPWTQIKKWYDEGSYIPYTEKNPDDLVRLLMDVKQRVHPWIRLNRVIRDIPNYTRDGELYIYAGNKVTNLRQILHNNLEKEGKFCNCIRCREVKKKIDLYVYARIIVRHYLSSGGDEYFISMESGNHPSSQYINGSWFNLEGTREPGIIYGFARLRLSTSADILCLQKAALIRELHVYGQVATSTREVQHRGVGKKLMECAEQIALSHQFYKIAVISGIGVRNYYRRLGYELEDTFMIKKFNWYTRMYYDTVAMIQMVYMLYLFYLFTCNIEISTIYDEIRCVSTNDVLLSQNVNP